MTLLDQIAEIGNGCHAADSHHSCCTQLMQVCAKLCEVVEASMNVLIVTDPEVGTRELRQLNDALKPMPETVMVKPMKVCTHEQHRFRVVKAYRDAREQQTVVHVRCEHCGERTQGRFVVPKGMRMMMGKCL